MSLDCITEVGKVEPRLEVGCPRVGSFVEELCRVAGGPGQRIHFCMLVVERYILPGVCLVFFLLEKAGDADHDVLAPHLGRADPDEFQVAAAPDAACYLELLQYLLTK